MIKQVCTPFLTEKELDKMNNGQDFYIWDDDATLAARTKRHFPIKLEFNE